jgi:membrane protein DedA with SNARE-associated domain
MSDTLLHLVEHFGYVIVAALILAEGVGLPLPGEAALVIGSALAATTGRLTLIGVMIAAAVGAIGGAAGGYWIGASLSDARLHRWAARFGMAPARLERAQQTFRKHIVRTAILGRFVTLLRMVVALLAGASRMPFGEFMLYSSIGAVIWTGIYGTLGYVFGSNLPRLEHELGRSSVIILLAVILVGVLLYARHRRRVESEP